MIYRRKNIFLFHELNVGFFPNIHNTFPAINVIKVAEISEVLEVIYKKIIFVLCKYHKIF